MVLNVFSRLKEDELEICNSLNMPSVTCIHCHYGIEKRKKKQNPTVTSVTTRKSH